MSTDIRVYDQAPGDPVVVMVTSGTYDVSRLAALLHKGRCEDVARADYIRRELRRHRGGRAALKLLRDHGGPDLLEDVTADDRERGELRAEVDRLRAERDRYATALDKLGARIHRDLDPDSAYGEPNAAALAEFAAFADECLSVLDRTGAAATSTDPQRPDEPAPTAN